MNGYDEKHHYDDEPQGGFVRAFDAFREQPLHTITPFGESQVTLLTTAGAKQPSRNRST